MIAMRIIVLAAGKGERLMPLTRNTPKPLLDIGNGKTLLELQLESMEKSGVISEVILVIGYLADQIEAKLNFYKRANIKIETVYNPFFDISNNLISLWLARYYMDKDFMITNGDNIFNYKVFKKLAENNDEGIFLTINKRDSYDSDDMKVLLENNKVMQVSKLINNNDADAESVGLAMIRGKKYRKVFIETLESLVRNKEYLNKFWLEVFNKLSEGCVHIIPFEIDGRKEWREIDFHFDLSDVRMMVKEKLKDLVG